MTREPCNHHPYYTLIGLPSRLSPQTHTITTQRPPCQGKGSNLGTSCLPRRPRTKTLSLSISRYRRMSILDPSFNSRPQISLNNWPDSQSCLSQHRPFSQRPPQAHTRSRRRDRPGCRSSRRSPKSSRVSALETIRSETSIQVSQFCQLSFFFNPSRIPGRGSPIPISPRSPTGLPASTGALRWRAEPLPSTWRSESLP